MTRSVEIPEAELQRVTRLLHEFEHGRLNSICPGVDDCQLWYDAEFRTAYLLRALPYLAPAEHNHADRCCCLYAREADSYEPVRYCPACTEHATDAAPAVPQPTREAFDVGHNIVNQLADLWEVPVDVRQATNDRCWEFAAELVASAVPQPVDREALLELVKDWQVFEIAYTEDRSITGAQGDFVNAVLAVLAGEQEQG